MSRDPHLLLEDMLEACTKIRAYVKSVTLTELTGDTMRFDAVVRNIEIIGEAARQVPLSVRESLPALPSREMTAMRNILVHAYFGVDPDVVWTVATEKVPMLIKEIEIYLGTDRANP